MTRYSQDFSNTSLRQETQTAKSRSGAGRVLGILLALAGTLMVLAAVAVLGMKLMELKRSERQLPQILDEINLALPETPDGLASSISELSSSQLIPVHELGGVSCIGKLSIPALNMEWPVGASYEDVHLLPVVRTETEDDVFLTIEGMDYDHQFTNLPMVSVGDKVLFTDMNGLTYPYEVTYIGSAMGSQTGWDLKLITYNWKFHPYTVGCVAGS